MKTSLSIHYLLLLTIICQDNSRYVKSTTLRIIIKRFKIYLVLIHARQIKYLNDIIMNFTMSIVTRVRILLLNRYFNKFSQ